MQVGAFSWDVSFLETDLGVGGGIKSFKQGTECGRELFLVTRRSEAGGREAGGSPTCDPGERCQWSKWIRWEQEWRQKGEIRILLSVH